MLSKSAFTFNKEIYKRERVRKGGRTKSEIQERAYFHVSYNHI